MTSSNFKINTGLEISSQGSNNHPVSRTVVFTTVITSSNPIVAINSPDENIVSSEINLYVQHNKGIIKKSYTALPVNHYIWSTSSTDASVNREAIVGPTNWQSRTAPFVRDVVSIGHNGTNLFVAGDQRGNIASSTDGITWTTRTSNLANWTQVNRIVYAQSKWVLVGYYGATRTSTDGITWTTRTNIFGTNWNAGIWSLAYNGTNKWLAGGYGNPPKLAASTDAITWTTVTTNPWTGYGYMHSLHYANGTWLLGGSYGKLYASTDGVTWVSRTSNWAGTEWDDKIRDITYGSGKWVAVGYEATAYASGANAVQGMRYSTDAINWVTATPGFNSTPGFYGHAFHRVIHNGSAFLAGSYREYDNVQYSTDGVSWAHTPTRDSAKSGVLQAVSYNSDRWVVAGGQNSPAVQTGDFSAPSAQIGANLTFVPQKQISEGSVLKWMGLTSSGANVYSNVPNALNMAYGGGQYVISGGYGKLVTSTDTITWVERSTPFASGFYRGLAYGQNKWMATGRTTHRLLSTDAVTWTSGQISDTNLLNLTYSSSADRWAAVGYTGRIRISTDGTNWTSPTSNTSVHLYTVARSSNLWLAAGAGGTTVRSTDGVTWVSSTATHTTNNITSIVWGTSIGWVLYAEGSYGGIRHSTDGITWVTRTYPAPSGVLNNIEYNGTNLLILGSVGSGGARYGTEPLFEAIMSTDAITWTTAKLMGPSSVVGTASTGGNAASDNGIRTKYIAQQDKWYLLNFNNAPMTIDNTSLSMRTYVSVDNTAFSSASVVVEQTNYFA